MHSRLQGQEDPTLPYHMTDSLWPHPVWEALAQRAHDGLRLVREHRAPGLVAKRDELQLRRVGARSSSARRTTRAGWQGATQLPGSAMAGPRRRARQCQGWVKTAKVSLLLTVVPAFTC